MKAYLIVTGALFGLLAAAHLARIIDEWNRLISGDTRFLVQGPGVGLIAAALCFWAVKLFRAASRS